MATERKIVVQTLTHTGLFINGVNRGNLSRLAVRSQDGLILSDATVAALGAGTWHLSATVTNRVLTPINGDDVGKLQQRAEQLTLCGDNVWVQVPVMTAGQFNRGLIQQLLSEGVPLAVNGVASKQQAYQLLMIARDYPTPLLINLCPAIAHYDLVVSVALAHLLPQVQVVSPAPTMADFWAGSDLQLDGMILSPRQFAALQFLAASASGQTCSLRTRQQYELVMG